MVAVAGGGSGGCNEGGGGRGPGRLGSTYNCFHRTGHMACQIVCTPRVSKSKPEDYVIEPSSLLSCLCKRKKIYF